MANLQELHDLDKELCNPKSKPTAEQLGRYLRIARELKTRDSRAVAQYGEQLLRNHRSSVSEEELWLVHEQVAVAALDCGAMQFAASVIRAVARRFPESSRTRRLQGMYWEAQGTLDRAEEIYREVLKAQPSNEIIHKRLVALEKSRGNTSAALEALRKYLDTFPNDVAGWEEAAELYLELLMYKQALFCYEELIMLMPTNVTYLVRYADVLYTLGGNSNLRMARSYFAKAVELSAGASARALWGVLACSANITDKVVVQDARTRAQIELPTLSAHAVLRLYKQYAPDKVPVVMQVLQKQGLGGSAGAEEQ